MKITTERRQAAAVMALCGTFDFSARGAFKDAYEHWLAQPDIHEIRVDLHGVCALDASAPGMLLVLRERARDLGKRLSLANAHAAVKEALSLTALLD
jgi:anti-anti-sigma factor